MADQISTTILTQYFYPEVPGTAQISTDLAQGLKQAGFEVSVFTGQPAYVGSRRLPSRDSHQGVSIHRAYSRGLSRDGTRSRLVSGATVAASTFARLLRHKRPSVAVVDSTSPFLMVAAWLLRLFRRVPYVVVVQDVYPEIAIRLGIIRPNGVQVLIWRWAYRRVYGAAQAVVVLGPRMREVVERSLRRGHRDKFVIIPNWADGKKLVPRLRDGNPMRRELGLDDKLVVIYSGNMGLTHDMETAVLTAERLQHLTDLRFLFIGEGGRREVVDSTVRERRLKNVTTLPYQPQEMLPYSLTCGDISLVTLEKGIEGLSVPSKLYSSLAAGLAILAVVGPGSEIGDVVDEYECGYRVSQGDVDGLVGAVVALHDDPHLLAEMRGRARACFEANYTREMSIARYVSLLTAVATKAPLPYGAPGAPGGSA